MMATKNNVAPSWIPSFQYRKIAEANRLYYAKTALMYDSTEAIVTGYYAQQMLESDITQIVSLINKHPRKLHALDACGGSGNISMKLLKRRINVTLCDISPDLINIFRSRSSRHGFLPKIICDEIGEFLSKETSLYDLIVFSSALHHLENIEDILSLAFKRLAPGGFLFTVFDPISRQNSRIPTKIALMLDYITFKIYKQPSDLPAAVIRRLQRTLASLGLRQSNNRNGLGISNENLGALAEYHIKPGIDDYALLKKLNQIGFQVVWHKRYIEVRYGLTRFLLRLLGDVTAFKLLLRRKLSDI